MYVPKYFVLQEFFPKDYLDQVHSKMGERLWLLIDNRVLWTADHLRERYGSVIANDWLWRTNRVTSKYANNYRGFRPSDCNIGAVFSQHKYGRALDCKFKHANVEEVRQEIIYNDTFDFKYITAIEVDVPWLHFDVRNHDKKKHGVKLIKP